MASQFEYLGGSPTKKKPRTFSQTIGKVVPIVRPNNPYYPHRTSISGDTGQPQSLLSLLGQAQRESPMEAPSTSLIPNYESDPILARIRALGQQNSANARSEAANLRKQAVIDAGITEGDLGVDPNTLEAARQNPFSAVANLRQEASRRERDLNEFLNREGNLFYSGHRVGQLSDLARSRAAGEADISRGLGNTLNELAAQLAAAEAAEVAREQEALEAAAEAQRQREYEQTLLDALAGANEPPPLDIGTSGLGTPITPEEASVFDPETAQIRADVGGFTGEMGNVSPLDIANTYGAPVETVMDYLWPEGQVLGPLSREIEPSPTMLPDPFLEPDLAYLLAMANRGPGTVFA